MRNSEKSLSVVISYVCYGSIARIIKVFMKGYKKRIKERKSTYNNPWDIRLLQLQAHLDWLLLPLDMWQLP
jgi:hypothetical protein